MFFKLLMFIFSVKYPSLMFLIRKILATSAHFDKVRRWGMPGKNHPRISVGLKRQA